MYDIKYLQNYHKNDLYFKKKEEETKKQEIINYMNDMKPVLTVNGKPTKS